MDGANNTFMDDCIPFVPPAPSFTKVKPDSPGAAGVGLHYGEAGESIQSGGKKCTARALGFGIMQEREKNRTPMYETNPSRTAQYATVGGTNLESRPSFTHSSPGSESPVIIKSEPEEEEDIDVTGSDTDNNKFQFPSVPAVHPITAHLANTDGLRESYQCHKEQVKGSRLGREHGKDKSQSMYFFRRKEVYLFDMRKHECINF